MNTPLNTFHTFSVGEPFNMAALFLGWDRELATIDYTGLTQDVLSAKMETTCKVDLIFFPFDKQVNIFFCILYYY